ncbi:MAG: hypothetical protein ABF322_10595 [Lentimonas sp.]
MRSFQGERRARLRAIPAFSPIDCHTGSFSISEQWMTTDRGQDFANVWRAGTHAATAIQPHSPLPTPHSPLSTHQKTGQPTL